MKAFQDKKRVGTGNLAHFIENPEYLALSFVDFFIIIVYHIVHSFRMKGGVHVRYSGIYREKELRPHHS
jgi:hypothetical protein